MRPAANPVLIEVIEDAYRHHRAQEVVVDEERTAAVQATRDLMNALLALAECADLVAMRTRTVTERLLECVSNPPPVINVEAIRFGQAARFAALAAEVRTDAAVVAASLAAMERAAGVAHG